MTVIENRFVIVRHPDSSGAVVAKFDGGPKGKFTLNSEIENSDSFVVQTVPDRSGLDDKTIDQSGLTDTEKDLLKTEYPLL